MKGNYAVKQQKRQSSSLRGAGFLLVCVASLLAGCARMADTAQSLFVSVTPAVAMVGPHLMSGQLQVYNDNTGFIALESAGGREPIVRCSGRMPVTGSFSREIDLRCNNGLQARLAMSMRTDLRGFAYGNDGDQLVSLVFGLEGHEVMALLKLPAGTTLTVQDGRYVVSPALPVASAGGAVPLPPAEAAGVHPPLLYP